MTTATPRPGRLVLGPLTASVTTGLLLVGLGAAVTGSPGALGAGAGSAVVAAAFLFGTTTLGAVARLVPAMSLVFALVTYAFQLAAITLVFVALARSGALGSSVDPRWLAAGVIGSTLAWTAGQIVANVRARVLLYDLPAGDPEPGVR